MKGYIIFENFNKLIECKEILDGYYNCVISDYPNGTFSGVINRVTGARCNKSDTYDFETGALIALMKMCGSDKVVRACNEAFSYERDLHELREENKILREQRKELHKNIDELFESEQHSKSELGRLYFERHRLEEKVEKLKLDCEMLRHGYNDTDSIFCGGRQNGKQYTALVDLFKKIDQKKVDEAYKEAYNTILPVWQKEVLKQMYGVYKESKEKIELPRTLDINGTVYRKSIQIKDFSNDQLDSLIEGSRAFTRKFGSEWLYKIPTKREEMWDNILGASKCPPVEIKVAKEDVTSFLRELQDKIPETRWNGSDCLPTENIVHYWFKHDYIYFALFRNGDKGNLRMCYDDKPHSWINKPVIIYLPPMRWDLFKKGRLAVKVNYNNRKEFYESCEKELGKKPSFIYTGDFTVSICKKDGNFEIFTMEDQKKTGRKIVDWEDVR